MYFKVALKLLFFFKLIFIYKVTPTIRKCVSQKEISSLQALGIKTKNGCHDLRTAKRRHKLYCCCETDLCNYTVKQHNFNFLIILASSFIYLLIFNAI